MLEPPLMRTSAEKAVCIRFVPRYQSACRKVNSIHGDDILCVTSCRYLGIWLTASGHFKVDISYSKKSFFRAVNAVFGKVLGIAMEESILHLISAECMPMLLYGLNACPDKRLLTTNRGSNCSLTRATDGRIVRCRTISSCQSAATSEIVKRFWSRV